MEKPELRELFKQLRKSATNQKAESSSLGLLQKFKEFLIKYPIDKKSIVAAYLPAFNEISPLHIMEYLFNSGYKLAVPAVCKKDSPLSFYFWDPFVELALGECKNLEPKDKGSAVIPDVILMPLLAFDAKGFRLGMGGGYYDRTLDFLNQQDIFPTLIGLAFSEQYVDELPKEEYDKPVNYVITEQRIYKF